MKKGRRPGERVKIAHYGPNVSCLIFIKIRSEVQITKFLLNFLQKIQKMRRGPASVFRPCSNRKSCMGAIPRRVMREGGGEKKRKSHIATYVRNMAFTTGIEFRIQNSEN